MKSIKLDYEDLISDSLEIRSAPPAVYQPRTKKEQFGTLTRVTVGQKDVKRPNKTILLVGETGTGKSTLINALVNHAIGVKFEDEVWFQIIEEEKRNQSESQTSDVIVYQIYQCQTLPFSLKIIDTPGFGDTRGVQHDVNISQRLLDLFRLEDGVKEIHAVGLVMKATDNRLSEHLMYIFDSVMALFGKDMESNIVALMTHSGGGTPVNALNALKVAEIKCAKDAHQPVHFMFDNNQATVRDTALNAADLKHSWEFTSKQITRFTNYVMSSSPQTLKKTTEVLNERIRLSACIQNLQERVELTELKQEEIKQTREALKKHEKEMENNKEFTLEVDEAYKDKEPIGGMWGLVFYESAVCCTKCKENCHYPGCTVAWYPDYCEVMKNGCCTVCRGKCPVSVHVKEKWKYVSKTKKVQKTLDAMKKMYENNQAACKNKSDLLENLEKESIKLSKEKSEYLNEAYQHVVRLEQIALNVVSVSTFVHLNFLIEKMDEERDGLKVQKLKELKKAIDEKKANSVLSYMMSGLLTGKKHTDVLEKK